MERFQNAVLRRCADPGVNCAEGPWKLPGLLLKVLPREVRNARSLNQRGKRKAKVGGAERNRTADEGFADPCLTTWLPRHPVVHAATTPPKEKPTGQVFRRWAAIPRGCR